MKTEQRLHCSYSDGRSLRKRIAAEYQLDGETSILWVRNFRPESTWIHGRMSFPYQLAPGMDDIESRYSELSLFVAEESDFSLIEHSVDPGYIKYLQSLGFGVKMVHSVREAHRNSILVPWATTLEIEALAKESNLKIHAPSYSATLLFNNKCWVKELLLSNGIPTPPGGVCRNLDEMVRLYEEASCNGVYSVVIKQSYGTSGLGLLKIEDKKRFESFCRFIRKRMNETKRFEFLVERWVVVRESINSQFYVNKAGQISFLGMSRQLLKEGVYRGSEFVNEENKVKMYMLKYDRALRLLSTEMLKLGYYGLFGIDSLLGDDFFFPIIEINGRINFSTYGLEAWRRLGTERACVKYYDYTTDRTRIPFSVLAERIDDDKVLWDGQRSKGILPLGYGMTHANKEVEAKRTARFCFLSLGSTVHEIEEMNNYAEDLTYNRGIL